ncbi:MAG: T9SS type A sorting domain-containing protein [Bacteroidia bacterium]
MRKIFKVITAIFLLYAGSVSAHEQCEYDAVEQSMAKLYPNYASDRMKQETFTNNYRSRTASNARMLNFGCQPTTTMYTIPIVVHIVHVGEPIGTGSNLTDAQVRASVDSMNRLLAPTGVKCVLAQQDPNGNPTTGITRMDGRSIPNYENLGIDPSTNPTGAPDTLVKKPNMWPIADYVNVFFVKQITIGGAYSSMPSAYKYQGLVIQSSAITSVSGAKTFAHEMGHYLDLFHTFQGSSGSTCALNSSPYTQGDKCGDTPPVLQADCSSSSCGTYPNVNNSLLNIMGYCWAPNMIFTPDQRDRVQAAVRGPFRWSLVSSHGLIPTSGSITEVALDSLFFNQDLSAPLCNGFLTPVIQIKNLGTIRIDNLTIRVQSGVIDTLVHVSIALLRGATQLITLPAVKIVASGSYNVHTSIEGINGSDSDYNAFNNELCVDVDVIVQSVTVSTNVNIAAAGSMSGAGIFSCNDILDTLNVVTNTGYVFQNIKRGNTIVSTNPMYVFPIDLSQGNQNFTANFAVQTFTVTATTAPTNGGTVTGFGTFNYGSTPTVTFKSKVGYRFVNATENGNPISTDSVITLPALTSNRTIVGNFTLKTFLVNVSVNGVGGTVTGGGSSISYGTNTTVTANEFSCYQFTNWTENGSIVSTNKNYTFTVTNTRNLVANFTQKQYVIGVVVNNASYGTVSGGNTYGCGNTATVKAHIKPGGKFLNWTENGVIVSLDSIYSFQASVARTLVANFEQVQLQQVNAGFDQSICFGSTATLTATNSTNYLWSNNQSQQTITVSPTTTTSYVVTGSNGTRDTVVVIVKPLPDVAFTRIIEGNRVQFTAPNGNTTYSWNFGDSESSSDQNPLHTYTTNGKKYVTLQSTLNSCTNQRTDSVLINCVTTGIITNTNEIDFKICPNPTTDFITVTMDSYDTYNVEIFDLVGQSMWTSKDVHKTINVDVSYYPQGIYVIKVDDGKSIGTKRFIVNK